jgi:hypothetical protein
MSRYDSRSVQKPCSHLGDDPLIGNRSFRAHYVNGNGLKLTKMHLSWWMNPFCIWTNAHAIIAKPPSDGQLQPGDPSGVGKASGLDWQRGLHWVLPPASLLARRAGAWRRGERFDASHGGAEEGAEP